MKTPNKHEEQRDKDAASYAAESHPLAGGIGAVGGGLTGAAIGSAIGPLGALTGAALGATFGAIVSKGIAEGIDPEAEQAYWKKRYREEPYYENEYAFDDYGPAYRMGWQLFTPDMSFEAAEQIMSDEWEQGKGSSRLPWTHARNAAKASWERVEKATQAKH
ncbi:MAG TPA: glycine zipper domain-containing protein [Luteolibacter sp.]